jgi:hypothetical protein
MSVFWMRCRPNTASSLFIAALLAIVRALRWEAAQGIHRD